MTIIVGYRQDGATWLGSDSRSTSRDFCYPETVRKLHRVGNWLIAAAGPQLVMELASESGLAECRNIGDLRDRLFLRLRETMKPFKDPDGEPDGYRVDFIVGSADGLWAISCNGAIWQPDDGFCAAGSGSDFAYGAAYGYRMETGDYPRPHRLVDVALRAACRFSASCGGDLVWEQA